MQPLTQQTDADPYELLLKAKELELLKAKLQLSKDNGLAFYRPHEKQHEFHCSMAKRRGVFAGNRFGKSDSSAAETVAWFIGERTWYKSSFPIFGMRDGMKVVVAFHDGHENHPLVRQGIPQHATKQLIITTDWKKVGIVWTSPLGDPPGKLWKFMPAGKSIVTKKNHEGIIDEVYDSETNAVIRFTTEQAFMKNPQSAESTDNDRIAVDEPIVQEMWTSASRGLVDRNGQGDFTLTSLRERWIYDYFHPEIESDRREDRWSIRASMHDNPYLTDEAKQRYIDELSEDERQCRIDGLPLELSGLVYKHYNRAIHVLTALPTGWSDWANPPVDWTIYIAVDVHEQTPQAVSFVAVSPDGTPIVYDEIWRACVTSELIEEIQHRTTGRNVGFIKADPRAWVEDPNYKTSMASVFCAAGFYLEKASKAKDFGIRNLQSLFKARRTLPDARVVPVLFFTPKVTRHLWELARYHFDKENKPVDKDDHFCENLYRLFITPLPYLDPTVRSYNFQDAVPMTSNVLREFNVDAAKFNQSVQFKS